MHLAYISATSALHLRYLRFLDHRNVSHVVRGSGMSVVWPRISKAEERLKGELTLTLTLTLTLATRRLTRARARARARA